MGSAIRRLWNLAWPSYLVLLAVSHAVWLVRTLSSTDVPVEPNVVLQKVSAGERLPETTRLHFRDTAGDGIPVVLLHGSPGGVADFKILKKRFSGRRVVVPDLPGFGESRAALPDYSVAAHADYVLQLLDHLNIERAHLVGFSMGGGVALSLSETDPERVSSVTLLSSIGVVEHELFGIHELNHAVHGAQLVALHLCRWCLPHFGTFDRNPLNVAYARNFYDTDQRLLRRALEALEQPLLILHGKTDFLVPAAAATEHHRIVPQSELVWYERGHFLLMQQPEELAEKLAAFLSDVDAGRGVTRAGAAPLRIQAAAEPFDPKSIPPFQGPALIVALLGLVIATFVSEDLTCAFAGVLVAQGRLAFLPAVAACFVGIFIGDVGLYWLGRIFGRPLVTRAPFKWMLSEGDLTRASRWFERRGFAVVMASRFLPGLRLPTYVAGGVLRTSFVAFALHFALACLLWTPVLVGASAWAAEQAGYLEFVREHPVRVLLLVVVFLFVLQRLVLPLFTHTGRRLLVGSWRRKLRWEFWPAWVFYPPVVGYVAWLAFKHRSLVLVTAVNPGIPTGGFIGESKSTILERLGESEFVPDYCVLRGSTQPDARVAQAARFVERAGLPVVWKPDVGQRGSGVTVCRTLEDLEQRVRSTSIDAVLQEFVDGPEFGVFYYRLPNSSTGRVFSITEKVLPTVVGDGVRTLERLILDDARAVCAAAAHFETHAERLYEIPTQGEEVRLVELGTHARGAIFHDGAEHLTPELSAAFDRLSKGFEGFYFGRYDVRVPSVADLRAGRDFRVLELNGMTSEATHIYDSRHSVFYAYRVLCEQWRVAFEIAQQNRAAGAPVSSLGELVREWRRYQSLAREHV